LTLFTAIARQENETQGRPGVRRRAAAFASATVECGRAAHGPPLVYPPVPDRLDEALLVKAPLQ